LKPTTSKFSNQQNKTHFWVNNQKLVFHEKQNSTSNKKVVKLKNEVENFKFSFFENPLAISFTKRKKTKKLSQKKASSLHISPMTLL
jgi:hypothetical protein